MKSQVTPVGYFFLPSCPFMPCINIIPVPSSMHDVYYLSLVKGPNFHNFLVALVTRTS